MKGVIATNLIGREATGVYRRWRGGAGEVRENIQGEIVIVTDCYAYLLVEDGTLKHTLFEDLVIIPREFAPYVRPPPTGIPGPGTPYR